MRYDPLSDAWYTVPTTIDASAMSVTGTITKGGLYALFKEIEPVTTIPTITTSTPETTPVSAPFPIMLVIPAVIMIVILVGVAVFLIMRRTRAPKKPENEEIFEEKE